MKYIIVLILSLFLIGCSEKRDEQKFEKESANTEEEYESDSLTPSENFGLSLVQDILQDEQEVDLQSYLEEEIYQVISNSDKVTIDKIYNSMYLIKYYISDVEKNILVQKFYDMKSGTIIFVKTDINLNNIELLKK